MKYFCRFSECLRGESGSGSYFNDYCNWQNIPEFRDLIYDSPAAQVAGKLMKSKVGIWPGGGGGGTRVHHGRVGSAGRCDLKILHPWRRLKKGVKILQWPPPPNARKGGSIFYISMKSLQKRGSKIYNSKKYRGQNSTSLKMGVKILHAEK